MSWARYAAVIAVLAGTVAYSQTPGTFVPNQVLTASELNTALGLKLDSNGGLWTTTQTFQPSTVTPAIIVNAPAAQTANAAVTINKGTGGKAALEIKNAVDNSGRLQSWFGPNDIATDTPAQYIDTGGFRSKLFVLISGTSTGTGPSYNISFPSPDASMLSIWADVTKVAQFRCAGNGIDGFSGGGAAISYLGNNQASAATYIGSVLCDGTLAFGSPTNTTFTGQDAFLGYGGAAHLQVGGSDSSAPVAQTLGPANVNAPTTNNTGFLYGSTFAFPSVVGITGGMSVVVTAPPNDVAACPVGTIVSSVGAGTVTVNKLCNPYQGDTFLFGGTISATMTNQSGSTRIGYGSTPTGVVAGITTVTDVTIPAAIPGGTIVSSIDSSTLPGTVLLVLSNPINGVTFNTGPGGHDVVQFASTNIAAASMNFACGQGTGTGVGGDCTFKVAPAGSTGSTQNPLATAVTISGATKATTLSGTLGVPQVTWPNNQTCIVGQISVDANFIYVCTASNTVKRAALAAF